jgi:hypothetical protein
MKRYGDNLPSNCPQAEIEGDHGRTNQAMLAGCAVRYDMLAYIQPTDTHQKRKLLHIFSFLKLERKKPQESNN